MKLNELSYSSLNFTLSPGNIALQLKRIHHRVKNALRSNFIDINGSTFPLSSEDQVHTLSFM